MKTKKKIDFERRCLKNNAVSRYNTYIILNSKISLLSLGSTYASCLKAKHISHITKVHWFMWIEACIQDVSLALEIDSLWMVFPGPKYLVISGVRHWSLEILGVRNEKYLTI